MSQTAQDRIDALIDTFESEWRSDCRPDVAAFLERIAEAERPALLSELVRLDLEYRLRAGEPARVEECLNRFPTLQAKRAEALELIALEYRVRLDRAERVRRGRPVGAPGHASGQTFCARPVSVLTR